MAKKKKKGKNKQVIRKPLTRKEGIKVFEKKMYEFLINKFPHKYELRFTQKEMKYMYIYRIVVPNPVKTEGQNTSANELNRIGHIIQKKLREPMLCHDGEWYSTIELGLLYCYFNNMNNNNTTPQRRMELWQYIGSASKIELSPDQITMHYVAAFRKTVTAISSVRNMIYSLDLRETYCDPNNPALEFGHRLGVGYASKKSIDINGNSRLVYRFVLPRIHNEPWYGQMYASDLKEVYSGNKKMLDIYIQSHALERLRERLDLLDEEAINYAIYENFDALQFTILSNGYILITIKLFQCKVGYFIANIIKDDFVIRTFLFITHATTPEGDKLKEICGLGRNDVPYWKIDRLSTFMNVDAEQYPKLSAMFEEAGCGDLFKLHNEEFSVEAMQTANLDGLRDYIKSGKQEVSDEVLESS
ncbi:hypothetical protein GCQ56_09505 [Marinifilum sp. N1E240]|uniref:hypothetical protein n=1 Tax=Marinifilum sp. N1E240 TaxID=2608082 RepID=UPI00128AFA6A|nr:hypothetical protein [Marinifilum sp. N1E240]MPQ47245.1 hypothetical protein [Marinifilum sp. N1E240]